MEQHSQYKFNTKDEVEKFLRDDEGIKRSYDEGTLTEILIDGAKKYKLHSEVMSCAKSFCNPDPGRNNNKGDNTIFLALVEACPEAATYNDFTEVYKKIRESGSKNYDGLFSAFADFSKKRPKACVKFLKKAENDKDAFGIFWDRCILSEKLNSLYHDNKKYKKEIDKFADKHGLDLPVGENEEIKKRKALEKEERRKKRKKLIKRTVILAIIAGVGCFWHYDKWSQKIDPESIMFDLPQQISIYADEKLDLSGFSVSYQNNGGDKFEKAISCDMLWGYDAAKVGTSKIFVEFNGEEQSFVLDVKAIELEKVSPVLKDGKLVWNSVEKADSYSVKLMDADQKELLEKSLFETQFEFPQLTCGEYTVSIVAESKSDKYSSSEEVTVAVIKPETPSFEYDETSDTVICTPAENCKMYLGDSEFDGNLSKLTNGSYTITAVIIGDDVSRLASDVATVTLQRVKNVNLQTNLSTNNRIVVSVDVEGTGLLYDLTLEFYKDGQKIDTLNYRNKTDSYQYASYIRNGVSADSVEVTAVFESDVEGISTKQFTQNFKINK